jgi:Relaxase/Mobilisation nuclease domain
MVSKVITGRSFRGCCRYVCQDLDRAVVLETEGVRGHNYKLMADDFEMQQSLRPGKEKAVFHGILSFYPGENPSDQQMVEIARSYLDQAGIRDTQYSITKHIDKNHLHLHVIANLVNNRGEAISDSWIGARGKRISQQLTLKHELKQALTKNLELTNLDALSEYEATKYKIYQTITDALTQCQNLEQLRIQLLKRGIDTLYKYKGRTQELQGISFKMGEYSYKGSQIDRQFSYGNLEKTLSLQQKQTLTLSRERRLSESLSKSARVNPDHSHVHGRKMAKEMAKTLDMLMRQEQVSEQTPYELTQEARRKRQRQRQIDR